MDDVRGVDVLEPAEELVQEVLDVLIRQSLIRIDDAMQIGIHQVHDDVDILKIRTSALFDQMWKRSNNTTN